MTAPEDIIKAVCDRFGLNNAALPAGAAADYIVGKDGCCSSVVKIERCGGLISGGDPHDLMSAQWDGLIKLGELLCVKPMMVIRRNDGIAFTKIPCRHQVDRGVVLIPITEFTRL